jgi:hypothetical protein
MALRKHVEDLAQHRIAWLFGQNPKIDVVLTGACENIMQKDFVSFIIKGLDAKNPIKLLPDSL